MFELIWSLINSASNAISPQCPIEKELSQLWKNVADYYLQKNTHNWKQVVEETTIPKDLKSIEFLLIKEDQDLNDFNNEKNSVGNGFELFLQNKIFQKLVDLAQVDVPLGISSCIFNFFMRLIEGFKQDILFNGSVFKCVQKLIKICDQTTPSPYEIVQVEFLSCLVNKIQSKPELIKLFVCNNFLLLKSLIIYLKSPDNQVCYKASTSIFNLIQLCDNSSASNILTNTSFFEIIIGQLKDLYEKIPTNFTTDDIEAALNKLIILDETNLHKFHSPFEENQENNFSIEVLKFLNFFRWFIFCDLLAQVKSSLISNKLAEIFFESFLKKCLCWDLLKLETTENVERLLMVTFIYTTFLKNMKSEKFYSISIDLIVSSNLFDEEQDKIRGKKENLLTILINRCNLREISLNDSNFAYFKARYFKLAIYTLQLFEEIFSKPYINPFLDLIVKYVINRDYHDPTLSSRTELNEKVLSDTYPLPLSLHLKNFINLIPKEFKSCHSEKEVGFEPYILEAQKKLEEYIKICSINWPKNSLNLNFDSTKLYLPKSSNILNTSNKSNQVFFEGPFLSMLFDNLQNMLQLPYEINLQVTSIISKIALFPNPYLTEYFLDTVLSSTKEARTLFKIIHQNVDFLQVKVKSIPFVQEKLLSVRNQLLGNENIDNLIIESDDQKILQALIMIEEFCKELAAISFVKYHYIV